MIEDELERLGLDPKWTGNYWTIHCPTHDDKNKSAICNEKGWITCFAGCRPQHINNISKRKIINSHCEALRSSRTHETNKNDYTSIWLELEPLENGVKGVPAKILNQFGWRKYGKDIFIPYFTTTKTRIPFYQIRHTSGNRRFSFAKNEKPITYGLECLPEVTKYLFVTEGSRDSVILRWAGLKAVALPSASSRSNLLALVEYCKKHNIILCWCGDRDDAGERLMKNIDTVFIDCRCKYKDIGEMLEAEGIERIKELYAAYS